MEGYEGAALQGRRVLVVEDEPIIALTIEDMLLEFGCSVVGPASRVADALALIGDGVDVALLDVNLGRETTAAVASALAERNCPFVFTTGYGEAGLPAQFVGRPFMQKPFRQKDLAEALSAALADNARAST